MAASNKIDSYEIFMNKPLGRGAFGTVYNAKHMPTGAVAAAKQIYIRSEEILPRVKQEISSMQGMLHPNLVRYYHHYKHPKGIFWLFMELCDLGNLDQYFVKKNPDKQQSVEMMPQMAAAINFLHRSGIVHRDIKPQNILLQSVNNDQMPVVKITDFGLSKAVANSSQLSFTTNFIGSRLYIAPVLFYSDGRGDKSVDIFSLGLTFFSMVCFKKKYAQLLPSEDAKTYKEIGHTMFTMGKERGEKLEKAKSLHEEVVEIKGDEIECNIRELIRNMIYFESKKRIEASHVLQEINKILHIPMIDNFEIYLSKKLGEGGLGISFEAQTTDSGQSAVAKQFIKKEEEGIDMSVVLRELESLKSINHPNIVKILHHHIDSKNEFWMFLEFCDLGNLDHHFVKNNPGDPEIRDLMKQIARAIKFLHDSEIVHGKIKPQNILLKSLEDSLHPGVKVADFGFQKVAAVAQSTKKMSSLYTAPEHRDSHIISEKSADIFSLGLIFLAMIAFKKESHMLIPSDDSSSSDPVGQKMSEMSDDYATQFENKLVPLKGDKVEKKIRLLVRKMVHFDKIERLSIDNVADDVEVISSIGTGTQVEDSQMTEDDMESMMTTFKCGNRIDAVSHNFECAAAVVDQSWDEKEFTVRLWEIYDHLNLSWSERDLLIHHSLDLKKSPRWAGVMCLLDNMLLLVVKLNLKKTQFLAVDSTSGQVLHKSQVYPGDGIAAYCCYKSQILLPDKKSSSITQIGVETLKQLNTWSDKRVREPWRFSSNKNRAAIENYNCTISVFKWEDEFLSNEKIYTVQFKNCNSMQMLPDSTLMGINRSGWSMWSESGDTVHSTMQHSALVPWMEIYRWHFLQDPLSERIFVQECGKYAGTDCRVIYDTNILINRLDSEDKSQIDSSQVKLNTTVKFK